MRRIKNTFLLMAVLVLSVNVAYATMPGQEVNPNGFPSGDHYNLNIIAKKTGFSCPEPALDEFGNIVYGNVIYVPQNGQGIQIVMQSGTGKKAAAIPQLQVIDPCTSAFDGDEAVLQLPKNENGYRVYARALAKPTGEPAMTIEPALRLVQDEAGNDLVYLGLVTDNGFAMPDGTFVRKTGKSRAVPITGMFLWTGQVCYFDNATLYDSILTKCCVDNELDGIYDACQDPVLVDGVLTCPDGYETLDTYCVDYTNEWIFNIGDFVEYLWSIDNNGLKLLQVRFYPN